MHRSTNRREFFKASAAFGAGLWVIGSRAGLRGDTRNDRVNVAIIGAGGRGGAHVDGIPKAGGTIVALCDVDERQMAYAIKKNPDGGVTIYVGPKAPDGLDGNWIPTAGRRPLPAMRFYGPTDAFNNKTFKLPDFELPG